MHVKMILRYLVKEWSSDKKSDKVSRVSAPEADGSVMAKLHDSRPDVNLVMRFWPTW